MKSLFRFTLLSAVAAIFVACGQEPDSPEPKSKDTVKLISGASATVGSEGGEVTVSFSASGDWTVAPSNDRTAWLSISPDSGSAGTAAVTVTVDPNDTPDERSATLRIKCGTATASVTVTQKQKDALTLTPSKTQFDAEGGSFTVEVISNIDYTFEIDVDWIHQSATKALTAKKTTFTVDENDDTRKREGSVTLRSSLGDEKITVYQEAGAPSVILSRENEAVSSKGGTFTVDINTNVDVSMAITAGAEWISEVSTKAMSTHSYTFRAAPNESTDSREGKITFNNAESGVEATVTVTQMQKDALVISQALYEIGASGGAISIEATTNVELDVRISEPWVRRITTKALENVSYGFEVEANAGYDVRECTITFSGGETPVSQTVTVCQDGVDGFIPEFEEEYTISSKQQILELKSRSNVTVGAESKAEWITVADTKSLSDINVSLKIAENESGSSRTGEVVISAPTLGIEQTVTITQKGAGEAYIPDEVFLRWLLSEYDEDSDGTLSKTECDKVKTISILGINFEDAREIKTFQGIEYFPNLITFQYSPYKQFSAPVYGQISGALDFSSNTGLNFLQIQGCPDLEKVVLRGCRYIGTINLNGVPSLSEIEFPEETSLNFRDFSLYDTNLGPELDLSEFYSLYNIYIMNCPNLKKVYLTTGIELADLTVAEGIEISYKGENLFGEAEFADPVFKEVLLSSKSVTGQNLDINGDGKLSYRELYDVYSLYFNQSMDGYGVPDGKVIGSLEDLGLLKNLTQIYLVDCGDRISAPIPLSLEKLTNLEFFLVVNCNITGEIPEFVGEMPKLKTFSLDGCPNLTGSIPQSIIKNTSLEFYLKGGNLDDTYIDVPSDNLIKREGINFDYIGGRKDKTLPDGTTCNDVTSVHFRSTTDGTGPVHPDGEVVLYHASTAGPGLDIFITGDGFTEANNTVGGTLETYMVAAAEAILAQEPYNKLKEYFNIWLIYAHSVREGTAKYDPTGLKFGSWVLTPEGSYGTHAEGDHNAVIDFVRSAIPGKEPVGTIAVIMNTTEHAGTCYWGYSDMYESLAVGYATVGPYYESVFLHEICGHGVARLGDEYQSGAGQYSLSTWETYGWYSNLDQLDYPDPALARWAPFVSDSRYAGEHLGVYLSAPDGSYNVYSSTENSIMRSNFPGYDNYDRFNAPSREAIWQRVQVLAHPEQIWPDWTTYISAGYNREEFIDFDLSQSPSPARRRVRQQAAGPERRIVLPDGRVIERKLPPLGPPVIMNLPDSR